MQGRRSYSRKVRSVRRSGLPRKKTEQATQKTIDRTRYLAGYPFTVTLKYWEDGNDRFEERLIFANSQKEADAKAKKYLSGMWGDKTEVDKEEGTYTSPSGEVIIEYRGASPSTVAEKAYLEEKNDVWHV